MKMAIFAFTLAVALAAGSAYSEMNAMNDSHRSISGTTDFQIDQENRSLGIPRREVDGIAREGSNQGY